MLKSFTRNYEDNSTEAGFQFTFYCDICEDGFKSSFIQSDTYKKGRGLRSLTQGAGILGNFLGGKVQDLGWGLERGGHVLSERFEGMSPQWQKEHEKAFEMAQNEVTKHFHRCHGCQKWVCDADYNEDEGMCIECAPRQEIYVAKARANAMKRNIDESSDTATVWSGKLESKTTVCPVCNKPAGNGKFCNNCGASMALAVCPSCGTTNSLNVKFCNECGSSMTVKKTGHCPACGFENATGTKFCGGCGSKI